MSKRFELNVQENLLFLVTELGLYMRQKAKLFNKFLQSYLISVLIKKFEFIFQEIFLSKTIQKYIDDPYCGFALTA